MKRFRFGKSVVLHIALMVISVGIFFMEYHSNGNDISQADLLIQPPESAAALDIGSSDKALETQFPYRDAESSGSLSILDKDGKELRACPLKHTSASARISGYIARVTVTQLFENPLRHRNAEAVYTFPMDEHAAIDSMTIKHGDHIIKGLIKPREVATAMYERARQEGKTAALLDQERPNIFTQSVANIEPGKQVEVRITYVTTLPFENGKFTFVFPTVVGPRFIPPQYKEQLGLVGTIDSSVAGLYPPIDSSTGQAFAAVPKILPPVAPKSTRAGHDVSIEVSIDAGCPISGLASKLHEVAVQQSQPDHARIALKSKRIIPNKDFVLSWDITGKAISSSYLNHTDKDGEGYLTVMMMPPKAVSRSEIAPRELVFLIDCSGSQSGEPLAKSTETVKYIVKRLNPNDTFQVVAFSNFRTTLFDKAMPANIETKRKAWRFLDELDADGGTFMLEAVKDVCEIPTDKHRLRIVTFMTDGYVGNDQEVISAVHQMRGTSRWFMFGVGAGVNRFLCERVAAMAGGEADYVFLNSPTEEIAERFYKKISSPVLTDVKLSFDGLPVQEVLPHSPALDVWAERPLYLNARYTKPAAGTITLTGLAAGVPYKQVMKVDLTKDNCADSALSSMWARKKVEELDFDETLNAGEPDGRHKEEIVALGMKHHIMTSYTSFIAVDELTKSNKKRHKSKAKRAQKLHVSGEWPAGMADTVVENPVACSGALSIGQYRGYNETYQGLHTFWGDDVISNLGANIGQLVGKWLIEFINGWFSDSIQFLVGWLAAVAMNNSVLEVLDEKNPAAANVLRTTADLTRVIGWVVLGLLFYKNYRNRIRTQTNNEGAAAPEELPTDKEKEN